MKVKQLIKRLQKEDQNAEVIHSSDEEGNLLRSLHSFARTDNYEFNEADGEGAIYEKDSTLGHKAIILYP